ncbi:MULTISPECIES: UxaA family hydrolase [Caproicibacterium]|uniref:Altronate dehydratase family protein n=1 Tax=Caproicibacterium argilliputei TaxID=3030016 RepID=A0AA97H2M7_9FIRM|nr:altronate dehydratase family protein [Caproicibacterium argilliputei]WOC32835.1 altronate dehydratase family protein [Caproicibacterium argilliputei]
MKQFIQIHPSDSVAVALCSVAAGQTVQVGDCTLMTKETIPAGHKMALRHLAAGEVVRKYGFPIGTAVCEIQAGSWVHTHNLQTGLGASDRYKYLPDFSPLPQETPREFAGYRRTDGSVGIRNEVWIIPTVGCVNAVVQEISRRAQRFLTPAIDGIYAFPHPYGCSQLGDDLAVTQKTLAGLIRHPNAGAVLVVGLGCENNTMDGMKQALGSYDKDRVRFLVCQACEDEVAEGMRQMEELCQYASTFRRQLCSVKRLVVGLKCGGSDGFSGITANPLVGAFSDRLIAQGGTTILTEVPEMFGAEPLLMNRCENQEVFEKTVSLIQDFKQYFVEHHQTVDGNPSPGNKAGGITTLEDKALGCVQKGGTAPICDVLLNGQQVSKSGFQLLQAPGNDLVAATALAASGAQLILFTTGRGTPFGCPVPTIKISSNSALAEKKRRWIDFDAGRVLAGVSAADLTEELFGLVLAVASGTEKAKAESFAVHDFAIFKDGVTL